MYPKITIFANLRPKNRTIACAKELFSLLFPCFSRSFRDRQNCALIAQLDRASACGAGGRRFESCWVHHKVARKPVRSRSQSKLREIWRRRRKLFKKNAHSTSEDIFCRKARFSLLRQAGTLSRKKSRTPLKLRDLRCEALLDRLIYAIILRYEK